MIQNKIKELHKLNEGLGFRSIVKWEIKENIEDLSNYELNEHQYKHADNVLDRHGYFIIMKDSNSDKYRILDVYSFCFLFMSNLAEHLIYNAYGEWTDKEKQYYSLCYDILNEGKLFD